jgi:hypothetical protein
MGRDEWDVMCGCKMAGLGCKFGARLMGKRDGG